MLLQLFDLINIQYFPVINHKDQKTLVTENHAKLGWNPDRYASEGVSKKLAKRAKQANEYSRQIDRKEAKLRGKRQ